MTYWIDLFTGTTWKEFRDAGARVTGFNERFRNFATTIQPGDVLICYLTGVKLWVGALEVVAPSKDARVIWTESQFPVRFEVRPIVQLDPEHGIPMDELEGRVQFFEGPEDRGKFKGFVRRSPARFVKDEDARLILDLLAAAISNPVSRPVDQRKLARKILFKAERVEGRKRVAAVVTIPEAEEQRPREARPANSTEDSTSTTRHTEIQYHLLKLGQEMGLDLWVARNDRSRRWNGCILGELDGIVGELPTQFNEATTRTVELIDVLWLKGNSIVAAFEVECTTSVYSGLLRMSDLLALQPNLEIRLYLVAPDERHARVQQEILRPTFALRDKPLAETCGFLSFSTLMEKIDGIQRLGIASSLKADFLEQVAEYFSQTTIDDE